MVKDILRRTLKEFIVSSVDPAETEAVYSDALANYNGAHPNHESVNHSEEECARGEEHMQTRGERMDPHEAWHRR